MRYINRILNIGLLMLILEPLMLSDGAFANSQNADKGEIRLNTSKGGDERYEKSLDSEGVKRSSLSKFELGPGIFALSLNDYRGSNEGSFYLFPIPYFIYRGEHVDAENSSVKGSLYERKNFRIGLSLMGSLPVSSKNNKARQGMPGLDPTLELGPGFVYDFYSSSDEKQYGSLGLSARTSYSLNFWRASHVGYFLVPYVSYSIKPQAVTGNSFIQFSYALMFADRAYHGYFYDVDPKYSRPDRPGYRASGGYSGWHTSAYFSKQFYPFYFYFFFRYDNLSGVAFEKSPLLKTKNYYASGLGFVWYLYQSQERAMDRLENKF